MNCKISVVVPCYKERKHVLQALAGIPDIVSSIYCVDDKCPERTGQLVEEQCHDPRVSVLFNEQNIGVGGSVIVGYLAALADGAEIIVKMDGDGQMDPALLHEIVRPVAMGKADYAKGNRFFMLQNLGVMPRSRLVGNVCLSFLTKLSTGYWSIFDPTNGFTAIHATALRMLPLHQIERRYFFESDMLFRLGTIKAVVRDVPHAPFYGDETSHLNTWRSIPEFFIKHVRNIAKRMFYNYFLRDFSVASVEIILGPALFLFGLVYGVWTWWVNADLAVGTPTGTIMIVALSLIMGLQLILSALQYDIQSQPKEPLQSMFRFPA